MERRQFLSALAVFGGGVLSSSTLLALEKSGPFPPANTEPGVAPCLPALVDTIIPRTDTPGAADAGMVDFVLQFAEHLMEAEEREHFLEGLQSFHRTEPDFDQYSNAERESVLRELLHDDADTGALVTSLRKLRELTIFGYYNSEAGASLELAYDPVPGPFHQVSIKEYDRTWAR